MGLKCIKFIQIYSGMAFILAAVLCSHSYAGSKTGADFLKIPIGARSIGLGQASSALVDQSDALNWNPAGIVPSFENPHTVKGSISLSHQELFFGNDLDYFAFAIPRAGTSFGVSITRLSYPDQEAIDMDRNKTGSFGASDLAVGTAMGINFHGIRMGTQLKYIRQQLAGEEATGIALDFGLITKTSIPRLTLGASVRNLGPSMRFIQENEDLPLTFSLGTAYRLSSPLVMAFDVHSLPRQHQTNLSFGTEFIPRDMLVLRAGYLAKLASTLNNGQKDETNRGNWGGISGFNVGLGLKLGQLNLDYALSPFGELGNIQSFTLSTTFGGSSQDKEIPSLVPETLVPEKNQPDKTLDENRKILILPQSNPQQELLKNE